MGGAMMQPRILRHNLAGQPIEWLHWQEAVCLFSRKMVIWTLGDVVKKVRGGHSRANGSQSQVILPSIIACGGESLARPRTNYPLNNTALFARDGYQCMYCARQFSSVQLTRDHIVPTSRGGDKWENVVAA